jgi:hypothetical protein
MKTGRKADDRTLRNHLVCHTSSRVSNSDFILVSSEELETNRWHTIFTNLGVGLEHFSFALIKGERRLRAL